MPSMISPASYVDGQYDLRLDAAREQCHAPADWQDLGERNGCNTFKSYLPGLEAPFLKGETVVSGVSPEAVLATLLDGTCRAAWDEFCGSATITHRFAPDTFAFYVAGRSPIPLISARDVGAVAKIYRGGDTIELVQTSIDGLHPAQKGFVRATVQASWTLAPSGYDTKIVMILHSLPNGKIPVSILERGASIAAAAPGHLRDFICKHGTVPFMIGRPDGLVNRGTETNLKKSLWSQTVTAAQGKITIAFDSEKMYKAGVMVVLSGEGAHGAATAVDNDRVTIVSPACCDGLSMTINLSPKRA
ncbi:uncharacterized protein L969DRAFT_90536 [Mixia osmundae IAM 14324]|uniref:START domain-containing protein n=1 Tax=Mixia osmundae (strain CBS 9802 / IAM 14324 / JCM 22182 / KY 12970) TaxID=764103 RepID=G7E2P8_MIXOS|nr:uncharacterized protein L969DRAFT_90536 [Mixia osmundae IAM 14324]KEI36973.1 hypothetical protein L969DRAFT_90536 [Mixia osmundae IAM 14324]GAA97108.1 hypothetical protein E5Q_03783 [Mixia osmundae IAM 14324]